jgi:regulator of protease activity HflC (stomatin/prohibitin superfamily)
MLDSLIQWLTSIIEHISPFVIVKEYENGIQLRFGKYLRSLKAGLYIKIPFVDEILTQHVVLTTLSLPAQSLVTSDNKNIVVEAMVKYKITDAQIFLLEVYDSVDAVSDISQGIIKELIMSSTWEQCRDNELDNAITKKVRNELKKFGVYVDKVTLTSISEIRTFRLINHSIFTP